MRRAVMAALLLALGPPAKVGAWAVTQSLRESPLAAAKSRASTCAASNAVRECAISRMACACSIASPTPARAKVCNG